MNYFCFSTLQLFWAFVLDMVLGDPLWMPHPVRWIGLLVENLEKRLYPPNLQNSEEIKFRGIMLVVLTIIICAGITWVLLKMAYLLWPPLGYILAVWIAFTMIACKSLHLETRKVMDLLNQGRLEEARKTLAFLVSRDTDSLDVNGISKSILETLSENISDGIVAPLFYLAVGGPVLVVVYKAINTLDSMIGYKNDKYLHFGWFAAKLDDVANYIPSRLTAFMIVLVSLVVQGNWKKSCLIIKRDGCKLPSPNAGYPQAAMAGALDIQLGGPQKYFGCLVNKPFLGDDIKPVNINIYNKAVAISYGVSLLSAVMAGFARYLLCGFG